MGYLPTNKQINEEVSNYDELTFFNTVLIQVLQLFVLGSASY